MLFLPFTIQKNLTLSNLGQRFGFEVQETTVLQNGFLLTDFDDIWYIGLSGT